MQPVLLALVTALPATILALATLIVSIRTNRTGDKTHTLVNSNMGIQLELNAVVTRRMANLTKDQVDVAAALSAEKKLADHEAKQAVVDLEHDV